MKMRRIRKLISVILALLLISSCAPAAVDSASSAMAKGERQNHSSLISSAASVETNSEITPSSPKNEDEGANEGQNASKQPSSDKGIVSSDSKNEITTPVKPSVPSNKPNKSDVTSDKELNNKLKELVKPIFYTDEIPGHEIDFEVKTINASLSNDNWDSEIAIIRSFEDLKAIYEGEKAEYPEEWIMFEESYTKLYPESFFEDNALIMLFVLRGLAAHGYSIDSVTRYSDTLYIYMNNVEIPKDATVAQVEASYRSFITVSKDVTDNIAKALVFAD